MSTGQDMNETTSSPTVDAPGASAARRTAWPIVLGLVALVSGVLSMPVILRDMAAATGSDASPQVAGIANMRAINLAIRMGLAIWLAWGSIDLLRRRRTAKKSLQGWAGVRVFLLCVTVIQLVATWFGAVRQTQATTADTLAARAFAIWMAAVLPIFVLVWFGREKIRQEVANWH